MSLPSGQVTPKEVAMSQTLLEIYDEQFQALDQISGVPLVGVAYLVKASDKTVFHGVTGVESLRPNPCW